MWILRRYDAKGEAEDLEKIDLPSDCWGDELYEHLNAYLPEGRTLDDYEYDGDSEFVAVMGKESEFGDFSFVFEED